MLNIDAPLRRVSLRPDVDFTHSDRRRSSFRVAEDFHIPKRLSSARPSITSQFIGARRVSSRSQVSTDSFELSDYRGSFSIYSHQHNKSGDELDDDYSLGNELDFDDKEDPNASKNEQNNANSSTHPNSYIYQMIPVLSLSGAIICLILNILIPGLGTIFSGCFSLCYKPSKSQPKTSTNANNNNHNGVVNDNNGHGKSHPGTTLCINFFVGLGQLTTICFLLVGWFWSLAWGIYLVNIALEHRKKHAIKKNVDIQKKAIHVLLTDAGPGGAIRSGMMGINSMFKNQEKQLGIDPSPT